MAANSTAFSHLLAPGLRKIYYDRLKKWEEEYSKVAHVLTSKRAYEDDYYMAGLGRFEQKEKGKSITYDSPIPGDTKRYTHTTFALGFRVERELYDDDQYGIMKKMSKELAFSAIQTVELEFGAFLDDAFTGGTYTGADGKALCATDHPLLVGGTYANEPTTQADLGIGSLRASSERLEKVVDDRGLPRNIGRGKTVIVSPTYQWVAAEIIKTVSGKPYTSENTINAFQDMGLSYMVSHYTSDDDLWLLLAEKDVHDINFFWRQRPIFDNSDDFDTKDAKFSGFMRFSLGFTDWRGVDGSSGG